MYNKKTEQKNGKFKPEKETDRKNEIMKMELEDKNLEKFKKNLRKI